LRRSGGIFGSKWDIYVQKFFMFRQNGGHRKVPTPHKYTIECGYLSAAKCKRFPYGQVDATATLSFLDLLKSKMVLPFWCWLIQFVRKEVIK